MAEYFAQQIHHVPGRLRLKLAAIKSNEACARFAQRELASLDGVRSAHANPLTGSIVVRFDPCIASVTQIFDALTTHGLLDERATLPAAEPSPPSEPLAHALVEKVLHALLERCAVALVAALI